jgi:hypothetical protein
MSLNIQIRRLYQPDYLLFHVCIFFHCLLPLEFLKSIVTEETENTALIREDKIVTELKQLKKLFSREAISNAAKEFKIINVYFKSRKLKWSKRDGSLTTEKMVQFGLRLVAHF